MTSQVKRSAWLLIATGILHNTICSLLGVSALREMVGAGFFNSVDPHFHRMAIFWCLFAGFGIMMWGQLLLSMKKVPRGFAWSFLLLCCVGAVMMPISGFWLCIPQAIYMLKHDSLLQEA
jgi:hypothetical protein